MKKKVVVLIAAVVALAVVAYFALPALLMKWASDSERKAAGLEQKTAHVGDHEIVYIEGGQGEAILMVHGFAANKDNWTRFAKFISPAYHVVALDLPGFAESTCLENESYGIAEQAKRLNLFADTVGLQKFWVTE
jgi:alpha-beta hydrolase superfamily lysophospholipase